MAKADLMSAYSVEPKKKMGWGRGGGGGGSHAFSAAIIGKSVKIQNNV